MFEKYLVTFLNDLIKNLTVLSEFSGFIKKILTN